MSFSPKFISDILSTVADKWLPDDVNDGHLDYFFFLLAGLMLLNLLIYIPIAYFYKYAPAKQVTNDPEVVTFDRPLPEVKDGEGVIVSEQAQADLHLKRLQRDNDFQLW